MEALARSAKAEGKEVVVVMGVGFVGAVMAAIIADAVDENGEPSKFVVGCQRPSYPQLLEDPPAQPRSSRRSRPRIPRWTS